MINALMVEGLEPGDTVIYTVITLMISLLNFMINILFIILDISS